MTEGILTVNEAVLNVVRRVLDQHQSIIDTNAKLLELLGYPVIVSKSIEMLDDRKGIA